MRSKYAEKYSRIAQSIREARKMQGLSQEDLANKIGLSKSYISKIEAPNCDKTFSLEVLFEISDALDIPIVELFKYL